MGKREKLINRIVDKPKDFTCSELVALMTGFGYELDKAGGSGRKFIHPETNATLFLHEPHPQNLLKAYQVRDVLNHLKQEKKI